MRLKKVFDFVRARLQAEQLVEQLVAGASIAKCGRLWLAGNDVQRQHLTFQYNFGCVSPIQQCDLSASLAASSATCITCLL